MSSFPNVDKEAELKLALERGVIQLSSNHFDDAANTFRQIAADVEADPILSGDKQLIGTVWWYLAGALYESYDYKEAAVACEKALSFHSAQEPNHYSILVLLGECYMGTASFEKAHHCFQNVLESSCSLTGEKLHARTGMAKLLCESREYEKAASLLEAVLPNHDSNNPGYYNTMLWLACCYENMWSNAKARECYQEVLSAPCAWEADKTSAQEALNRLAVSDDSQTSH
jgi:tetratricopeptide (TPR) repeat protein